MPKSSERTTPDHARELISGNRFAFGNNWRKFLGSLNEERIRIACSSLRDLLGSGTLDGRRVLDVGSGSGLFSLSAMRLGAAHVCSFDYDPESVACTRELKARYFPDDPRWTVLEGSVLDQVFTRPLGTFDLVYAWGVLHHTGNMWAAMENTAHFVAPGGTVALAIYNDQGWKSRAWKVVKKLYCRTPAALRGVLFFPIPLAYEIARVPQRLFRGQAPIRKFWKPGDRGMSVYHDWIDWLGGYPFEVARPQEVYSFFGARGFVLEKAVTHPGKSGNNEYVFRRT